MSASRAIGDAPEATVKGGSAGGRSRARCRVPRQSLPTISTVAAFSCASCPRIPAGIRCAKRSLGVGSDRSAVSTKRVDCRVKASSAGPPSRASTMVNGSPSSVPAIESSARPEAELSGLAGVLVFDRQATAARRAPPRAQGWTEEAPPGRLRRSFGPGRPGRSPPRTATGWAPSGAPTPTSTHSGTCSRRRPRGPAPPAHPGSQSQRCARRAAGSRPPWPGKR